MHYYKFNIGDWHLHTSHLTLVEEAVYFRLVNHYYDTEKPFKQSETQTLIRRLRLGNESVIVEQMLTEFFDLNSETYVHARCEKEIKSFKKKAKVNKSNGSKGGRPRIDKGLESNPEITQTVSENNPNVTLNTNHKPLTTNQEPLLKDNPLVDSKKSQPIPYQQIAELHNNILGDNFGTIAGIESSKRKTLTKTFWSTVGKKLENVETYFNYFSIAANDHQRGLGDLNGKDPWKARYDWIIKADTVEKFRDMMRGEK